MGNEESKPYLGVDYDPAGYLPPGLYDTTQIWEATGVKAKNCNNPLFSRWFPDYMYRGIGDPPFDPRAYPCAWNRNVPYNAWFVNTKWINPAEGTPKWQNRRPTGETWGNPWGPDGDNFICVLDEKDGISEGSKSVPAGNWGHVYPKCFQTVGASAPFNRLYFESVGDAQTQFNAGHLDDVSEINRVDPYNRDPCGGRGSLAMLVPWALAVLAGVGTSIALRYVVFDQVPPISLTALSVGAAGFGWYFGQAIQAKPRDRDYYVSSASAFLGVGAAVGGAVIVSAVVLPDWTTYELPVIAIGAGVGYFYLAPIIEPGISTGGGLLGSTLGFLGTIVGGIEKFFCGISNWDIDGCSPEKNESARSWDRVLLAAAAANSLGQSHDLDEKEKEVAFQAMLVNAANVNAYESSTDKLETLMGFDVARSWAVGSAPPNTEDNKPTNSFAMLGHVVQTELLPIEETQMQAWIQGLFRGQERNNKYMQAMFEKGDGALLQKCDQFEEIEQVPQFKKWMDKAYAAAQNGKMAPLRTTQVQKLASCDGIYTEFLQFETWQGGFAYLQEYASTYNRFDWDFLYVCKKSKPELYHVLYACVFIRSTSITAAAAVLQIEEYISKNMQESERTPRFYEVLLVTLGKWQFASQIADFIEASNVWRKWQRLASGTVETACTATIAAIESGDSNWKAVGAKAAQYWGAPEGCTREEEGRLGAYKLFGYPFPDCTAAVRGVAEYVQNVAAGDKQFECGVGAAFSNVTGFQCAPPAQTTIDAWVTACSQ